MSQGSLGRISQTSSDLYDPDVVDAMNDIDLTTYGTVPINENASVDNHPEFNQVKNEEASTSEVKPLTESISKPTPWKEAGTTSDRNSSTPTKSKTSHLKRLRSPSPTSYGQAADTYGSSTFGGFGDYMRRKRAKLQIQNVEGIKDATKTPIFKGLAIYINGYTKPSIQVLREHIVEYGGVFHAYLDRKKMITHIIATALTPTKFREFKAYKVVKPDWLMESIKAGALLRWQDYALTVEDRHDVSQGRKGQTQLSSSTFASTSTTTTSSNNLSSARSKSKLSEYTTSSDKPRRPTAELVKRALEDAPPIYMTDPLTFEEADRVPGYAVHNSNQAAQRLMASTQFRNEHTSVKGEGFIESYYQNSRLHHLATWKAELKELVATAQEQAEERSGDAKWRENGDGSLLLKSPGKGKGKGKEREDTKVIMHCDFDCFFVTARLTKAPHLKGKPVVVCHSQGNGGGIASTSEIASSSYEARAFGIKNGMSLGQARQLCPQLQTLDYDFPLYKEVALQFYTILMAYADDLEAVSVDEALLDVTSRVARKQSEAIDDAEDRDFAKDLAEDIRAEIRAATGCEISIGISHNIHLARLATRRAKPGRSYHLRASAVSAFLAPLGLEALRGVGRATRRKAEEKLDIKTVGELATKTKGHLQEILGPKTGETLWNLARGIDHTKLESSKERKSVSAEINYGHRFENATQAENFIKSLGKEVSRRLLAIDRKGRTLTLKILKRHPNAPQEAAKFMGHGICETFNKVTTLTSATHDPDVIGEHAWKALKSFLGTFDAKTSGGLDGVARELRGLGIMMTKLEGGSMNTHIRSNLEEGQALLGFKKVDTPTKGEEGEKRGPEQSDARKWVGCATADQLENKAAKAGELGPEEQTAHQLSPPPPPLPPPPAQSLKEVDESASSPPLNSRAGSEVIDVDAFDLDFSASNDRQEGPSSKPLRLSKKRPAPPDDESTLTESQRDATFLDALPPDLRAEIEKQLKEQKSVISESPKKKQRTDTTPAPRAKSKTPALREKSKTPAPAPAPPAPKTPTKKRADAQRIVRAMHPKTNRAAISPLKRQLFQSKVAAAGGPKVRTPKKTVAPVKLKLISAGVPTAEDFQLLGLDAEVFFALPPELQREQLQLARHNKGIRAPLTSKKVVTFDPALRGGEGPASSFEVTHLAFAYRHTKSKPFMAKRYYAIFTRRPNIFLPSSVRGAPKIVLDEITKIQATIRTWVTAGRKAGPRRRDTEVVCDFLVDCIDGPVRLEQFDGTKMRVLNEHAEIMDQDLARTYVIPGSAEAEERRSDKHMATAVEVMKLWRLFLRKFWPKLERVKLSKGEIKELREGIRVLRRGGGGAMAGDNPSRETEGGRTENRNKPHEEQLDELVGRLWWGTFWDIKALLDVGVKKRYGGKLGLK